MNAEAGKGGANDVFDPEQMIGQTIAGRYIIEHCIGRGGMGVVYLARQSNLDRRVVIKVLRAALVEDGEAMGRFEREARGLSTLQHPNIVTIHDFGQDEGRAYIVMEFVEGETISRRIRRDGPMELGTFMQIAGQILQGIGVAHGRGMVHRDIKPANIMLSTSQDHPNLVKILDFGLAKLTSGDIEVTKEQTLVGSAAYIAPELIFGEEVGPRSDVYALGILFYYMLSGTRPFSGDSDAIVLYKHVHEPPDPLVDALPAGHQIPERVIHLVHRCMAKKPDNRPADAAELLEALMGQAPVSPLSSSGYWPVREVEETSSGRLLGGSSQSVSLVRNADGTLQIVPVDGGSGSFSRDQSFVLTPSGQKRSLMVPVLVVTILLVVVGVGAYLLASKNNGGEAPGTGAQVAAAAQPSPPPAQTSDGAASRPAPAPVPAAVAGESDAQVKARLGAELEQVRALIEEGALPRAEAALDMVSTSDLSRSPELKSQAIELRADIGLARSLRKAQTRAEAGDLDAAIELYEDVLAAHADHPVATARLEALREQRRLAGVGTLKLSFSPRSAQVTIDGVTIRDASNGALERELSVGAHTVKVEARGYYTREEEVTVRSRREHPLSLSLQAVRRRPPSSRDDDGRGDDGDDSSASASTDGGSADGRGGDGDGGLNPTGLIPIDGSGDGSGDRGPGGLIPIGD